MTYCLALALNDGLVFASDTRSNAGSDYVTTYGKMHVFALAPDRCFVLLTAGNLATTQEIVNRLQRDTTATDGRPNLYSPAFMFEAAELVGKISLDVQEDHDRGVRRTGADSSCTLILGGQIGVEAPQVFMIYPEGNAITVSDDTPYLQIGESKYGKPILDRLIRPDLSLADGARLALVSLDATVKSNVTVGMPFDVGLYRRDSFALSPTQRFDRNSISYKSINEVWSAGIESMFGSLPSTVDGQDWALG